MKYVLIIFITVFFTACTSSSLELTKDLSSETKLLNSAKVWDKYKSKYKNSYSYTSDFVSYVGFGNETKIQVQNGKAISREYFEFNSKREKTYSYSEKISTLGLNKKGAKVKTIDALYKQCQNILDKKSENTNIYLGFDKKGLLSYCLYSAKNCVDDCSLGVKIKNIEFNVIK